jgi:hypothetical protein
MLRVPAAEYTSDNAYVQVNGDYMGSGTGNGSPWQECLSPEIAIFKMAAEIWIRTGWCPTVREMQKIVQRGRKRKPTHSVTHAATTTSTRRDVKARFNFLVCRPTINAEHVVANTIM